MHSVRLRASFAPVACVLFAGCASTSPIASRATVDALTDRRLGRSLTWTPDSTTAQRVDGLLTGELAVDSAVTVALIANPDLRATFESVGIAQADVAEASRLRNPILALSSQPGTNTSFVMQGVGVVFPFVDALQRSTRRRIALADQAAVERRVGVSVVQTAAAVRIAWAESVAAQELVVLRQQIARATAAAAATANALYAAGNVPDLTLAGERAMAEQAAADVLLANAAATAARQRLARVLGRVDRDSAWSVPTRVPLPDSTDTPSLDALEQLAIGNRLDLAAAYHDVVALAARAKLARRFALLPDGELGIEWADEPDGRFFGPALSFPLPVFNQGQPARAAALARWRQGVSQYEAQRLDVLTEVRARHAALLATRERALRIRRTVLPLRRTVVEESQKQFNAMNLSIFALLQARQGEIETAVASVDALVDYWTARAELERAVGGAFAPRGGPDVPPIAPPIPSSSAR
jgi:outer membrane protein, heavy metal efflux system